MTTEKTVRIVACPRCKSPAKWEGNPNRPFCSDQCRLVDLGRWASEEYVIPGSHRLMDDDITEDS